MDDEVWKPIEGWPYEVSSHGRVRRSTTGHKTYPGKIAVGSFDQDGYIRTILSDKGRKKQIRVHRVVCEAFCGPRPSPTHQAAHKDGSKTNNKASNLYWATPKENSRDQIVHGVQVCGSRHPISKLSEERVLELRQRYDQGGISFDKLGKLFGVTPRAAWLAYKGRTWARQVNPKPQSAATAAKSGRHR